MNITGLGALIKRNTKLYFKDKGMFFTSLITPLILLVLYGTFLSNVYEDTFRSALNAAGTSVSDKLIGGCVGGELVSSLLAVSCITVAFCSNLLMVQDKITGARNDITITPVKSSAIALSYYLSTLFTTLIICLIASGVCLGYLALAAGALAFANSLGSELAAIVYLSLVLAGFLSILLTSRWNNTFNRHLYYAQECYKMIHISLFEDADFKTPDLMETVESIPGLKDTPAYCFRIRKPIAYTALGEILFKPRTKNLYISFYWIIQILLIGCLIYSLLKLV